MTGVAAEGPGSGVEQRTFSVDENFTGEPQHGEHGGGQETAERHGSSSRFYARRSQWGRRRQPRSGKPGAAVQLQAGEEESSAPGVYEPVQTEVGGRPGQGGSPCRRAR